MNFMCQATSLRPRTDLIAAARLFNLAKCSRKAFVVATHESISEPSDHPAFVNVVTVSPGDLAKCRCPVLGIEGWQRPIWAIMGRSIRVLSLEFGVISA